MRVKLKFATFDGKVLHERGIVENWPADVPLPKTAVSLHAPEPESEEEGGEGETPIPDPVLALGKPKASVKSGV